MLYADLEVIVQLLPDKTHAVDMRFRAEPGDIDRDLALNVPVRIDRELLLGQALDPEAYGRALTAMVFGDQRLREAWITARTSAEARDLPLRIRLRLDPGDPDLHGICWETVHELDRGTEIARSERFLLSRYLDSADLTRLKIPSRDEVTALVVVASPRDLPEFGLSPFDGQAESARARSALGAIPTATLVTGESAGPVTLASLMDALCFGYTMLYVVCHGRLVDGVPQLALEDEQGKVEWVPGDELARCIGDLAGDRRPALVVLGSCQSVGISHGSDVPAALGLQLARAGVAAVLGMQGNVPLEMVARLMPRFLKSLAEEGEIDRALAVARSRLDSDDPWWMPVLFMRVRDGRLWRAEEARPEQAAAGKPEVGVTPPPKAPEGSAPARRGGAIWLIGAIGLVALAVVALLSLMLGRGGSGQSAGALTAEARVAEATASAQAIVGLPATATATEGTSTSATAGTPLPSTTTTAEPSISPRPSATPTPTATAPVASVDCYEGAMTGGFGQLYEAVPQIYTPLGCPLAAEAGGQAAIQRFENGTIYWVGRSFPAPLRDMVFVLVGDDSGQYQAFSSTEVGRLPLPTPQHGDISPHSSIGSVYYGVETVREALGNPITGEVGGIKDHGALQRFRNGLMLWTPDYPDGPSIFVLINGSSQEEGRFQRYADPNS